MLGFLINFFLLGLLLLLSAFFSCAETALTQLSKIKVKHWVYVRSANSEAWANWLARPQELLTAILVGNNLCNIFLSSFTTTLSVHSFNELPKEWVEIISGFTVFIIVVIFGEIIPKLYARKNAEQIAGLALGPLYRLSRVLGQPTEWMLSRLSHKLPAFKLATSRPAATLTLDEIREILLSSEGLSGLTEEQKNMMRKVMGLHNTSIENIMTPWNRVDFLVIDETLSHSARLEKLIDAVVDSGHTRLPIVLQTASRLRSARTPQILGYIYVNDLLSTIAQDQHIDLSMVLRWVRPLPNINGNKRVGETIESFRFGAPIACVRDASDFPIGIVTLEDVLEEFVGEILDEYDIEIRGKEFPPEEEPRQ